MFINSAISVFVFLGVNTVVPAKSDSDVMF